MTRFRRVRGSSTSPAETPGKVRFDEREHQRDLKAAWWRRRGGRKPSFRDLPPEIREERRIAWLKNAHAESRLRRSYQKSKP